jgi:choline-sulfatase
MLPASVKASCRRAWRCGLVLLAPTLACSASPAPPGPPLAVVERVSEAAGRHAEPLKLGTEERPALAPPVGTAFEVTVQAPVRAVVFSTAGGGAAPVRFALQARAAGAWRAVFTESAGPGEPAWRDHRVDAAELPAGARSFRFETSGPAGDPGASAAWGGIAFLGEVPALQDAPNVILISLDTLAAPYLSAYGDVPDVSPRIDAFLARGFAFARAHAQYGNTLVSHASLFTGLYPRHHGVYPDHPFVAFHSLVESLAGAGYRTRAFTEGAYVSSAWGFGRGFDAYDDGIRGLQQQTRGGAARTFARAGRWLEANADSRFFLFVHTYEVHAPYLLKSREDEEVAARITPGDSRVLSERFQIEASFANNSGRKPLSPRDLARLRALHIAEIHRLDGVVGDFLAGLERLGLDATTLVVLTSDHGDQFGEQGFVGHGNSLSNRVLHVPLGFAWPGHVEPGASANPVQLVDVLPTVLDLAGLPVPADLDGRSLAPLLRGQTLPERPAFSELRTAPGVCERLGLPDDCRLDRYAVQTGRFKLVRSQLPRFEKLYDLAADPLETRDVAAEHPDALQEHRALLDAYLASPAREPDASGAGALDAETLRQLEALGYLR